jgi:hypothetical protein
MDGVEGVPGKENCTPAQPFAAHLQNRPEETLAKKHTDRIIRGPQSPRRRKRDRRDLEKSINEGVDGSKKRCRMGGSPRTKRLRGNREIGYK